MLCTACRRAQPGGLLLFGAAGGCVLRDPWALERERILVFVEKRMYNNNMCKNILYTYKNVLTG